MRLKNRETGEIPEKIETIAYIQWSEKIMMVYINSDGERIVKLYDSLDSFNKEWKDYEEIADIRERDKRMRLKTKFQDEDFAMGEVVEAEISDGGSRGIWVTAWPATGGAINFYFKTLEELNSAFEDCEAPRVAYYIDTQGDICLFSDTEVDDWSKEKSIGNYFSTREEAEKAVEKLRAFKRLEDKGFRFDGYDLNYGHYKANFVFNKEAWLTETKPDLDFLFGGRK